MHGEHDIIKIIRNHDINFPLKDKKESSSLKTYAVHMRRNDIKK
jgi:hypothetical protein